MFEIYNFLVFDLRLCIVNKNPHNELSALVILGRIREPRKIGRERK